MNGYHVRRTVNVNIYDAISAIDISFFIKPYNYYAYYEDRIGCY